MSSMCGISILFANARLLHGRRPRGVKPGGVPLDQPPGNSGEALTLPPCSWRIVPASCCANREPDSRPARRRGRGRNSRPHGDNDPAAARTGVAQPGCPATGRRPALSARPRPGDARDCPLTAAASDASAPPRLVPSRTALPTLIAGCSAVHKQPALATLLRPNGSPRRGRPAQR